MSYVLTVQSIQQIKKPRVYPTQEHCMLDSPCLYKKSLFSWNLRCQMIVSHRAKKMHSFLFARASVCKKIYHAIIPIMLLLTRVQKTKASFKLKSRYTFRQEEKLIFGVRVLFANPLISQTHFKTSIYYMYVCIWHIELQKK